MLPAAVFHQCVPYQHRARLVIDDYGLKQTSGHDVSFKTDAGLARHTDAMSLS